MLNWANRFNIFCFLDNHEYQVYPHAYECVLAAGIRDEFTGSPGNAFEGLKHFAAGKEWLFGHFNYDLKNELETLQSSHPDYLQFPELFFFVPETVMMLDRDFVHIHSPDGVSAQEVFNEITSGQVSPATASPTFDIKARFTQAEYIETIKKLKQHILYGDCYEINFCQEFFQEGVTLKPLETYFLLSEISPTPFGAFYKLNDKYLLCASPERYLSKKHDTIISQPIKGTSKRNLQFADDDDRIKQELQNSAKDRSENVMVVDLVRNDLSKIATEGSVKVEELYAVYSFPQVHQMISTISGKIKPSFDWIDCIRATFPMASMTGAPKKRVMQLIEQYERSRRGLFSGAIGYVNPDGDFDFNVVIRSILYNSSTGYLSYQVGSAITFYSDPEKEYEECLLKGEAIKKVLT